MRQLEYITLVIKELIEFGLIEQIGMALEYSETMNKLLLFLKPVDELAMGNSNLFLFLQPRNVFLPPPPPKKSAVFFGGRRSIFIWFLRFFQYFRYGPKNLPEDS
jgi:hypothetical protein